MKYGLPIVSPVDDVGRFTEEAGQFRGLDVLGNGNVAVIDYLDEQLTLVMVEPYSKWLLIQCLFQMSTDYKSPVIH